MSVRGVFTSLQACGILLLCVSAASGSSRSYYDTLGVEPSASGSNIKKAFRRLAVKYHPDKNKSTDAEKTFREISEAYSVLSHKDKRRLYDAVGHEAFLKNEAPVDPGYEHQTSYPFGFENFYHDFDDSPFMEESHFHWNFHHHGEYEDFPFEEPGFSFYFGDEDEDDFF